MTSYVRTQVYLDRDEHRRLKRLAVEREASMTEIVREAVARYLTTEGSPRDPTADGLPEGPAGLVARMTSRRARAITTRVALSDDDAAIAAELGQRYEHHK